MQQSDSIIHQIYTYFSGSFLIISYYKVLNIIPCAIQWSEVKLLSRVQLFATPWTVAYQAPRPMGFSGQEYWSGLPFPSPGIFPTQGSNPGVPHCRQTLYRLSYQGSYTVGPCYLFHIQCVSVNPKFLICTSSPLSPFVNHTFVFYVCEFLFWKFICIIFNIPYVSDITWFVFLCLTSLSMIISRSNHVAADGILSFFLWLSNIPLGTYTKSSLSTYLLMDIWVASMSWLL